MNVLIIPEDFRKDQYLLKPLITKVLNDLGKSNANIRVCNPPLLGGIVQALRSDRLAEIIYLYPMVDMFILCVDRDGIIGRQDRLSQIEAEFHGKKIFIAVNAWEEIETWTLAGLNLPAEWSWAAVRQEVSVKERYFEPLAYSLEVSDGPGGGRKALGEAAARKVAQIRYKCPEDFDYLVKRIEGYL